MMEVVSALIAVVLALFAARAYFSEKGLVSHIEEGKPVICKGAVLEKARIVEIGGQIYVEEGDLMYHIDECEKLPEEGD